MPSSLTENQVQNHLAGPGFSADPLFAVSNEAEQVRNGLLTRLKQYC